MLQKYFLSFADVSYGSSRHQCVYIQCNKDAYTMQAASLAQEVCRNYICISNAGNCAPGHISASWIVTCT